MSSTPIILNINNSNTLILKLLLVCILFFQRTACFCPPKCTCSGDHNVQVTCIKAGLEEVPIQLNPDVKYINLTLNQILNVHYTLNFYTHLETLDLSVNKIDSLGSRHFTLQTQLRILNLSRNSLEHLHKDAFKGLQNLLELDLSFNRISQIHMTAMIDLHSLIQLNFQTNNLTTLEDGTFQHLQSLELLNFDNNQLLDVPSENLMFLRNLQILDLSRNLIEFIRNDSFDELKDLLELRLTENVINDIEYNAFNGLSGLKYLDLADNNLTIVPTLQLSKLSNLSYLSMSGNYFVHLPPVALLNLFHLRELHLSRLHRLIKIDSRAFVDNTFLHTITLNKNSQFTTLPQKLFHGNPNLMEISLKENNLHTLDAVQLPLDRLQKLYLGNNPFECNCSILWLWRLTTGQHEDNSDNVMELSVSPTTSLSSNTNESTSSSTNSDSDSNSDNVSNNINSKNNRINSNSVTILELDKQNIGCDYWDNHMKIRYVLMTMSESDIRCPGHLLTIISAIISVFLVIVTITSILIYLKLVKRKNKLIRVERKNVNERIVPQQVDKLELERYLAAAAVASQHQQQQQQQHQQHQQQHQQQHHQHHKQQHIHNSNQTLHQHHNSNHNNFYNNQLQHQQRHHLNNEYCPLRPWEMPVKELIEEIPDHYEKFEDFRYDSKRQNKSPHVVYV